MSRFRLDMLTSPASPRSGQPVLKGYAALLLSSALLFGGCSTTPPPASRARALPPSTSPPPARQTMELVSRPPRRSADTPPGALFEKCRALDLAPTDDLLCVSVAEQRLRWYRRTGFGEFAAFALWETFVCSTSQYGIGQQMDSYRTPLGLHRVKEKIGDSMPMGTIFKSRRPVGYTWRDDPDASITTRILWLDGQEPGFNQGGNVDSHDRYIYIHGTGKTKNIGRPASHGCVHLHDRDLVNLFDNTPVGTMVWIAEE